MAGVIGSMLKKRTDANTKAQEREKENSFQQHTCFKEIPPFPQFPPKKVNGKFSGGIIMLMSHLLNIIFLNTIFRLSAYGFHA